MHHRPRKRFGQNFLHDPVVIDRIVAHINPRPGDRLVEIGPGQAALTIPLLRVLGNMDAVEIDRDLVPIVVARCAPFGTLHVHNADALKFDFRQLATGPGRLRVVGNLPYNISTPILFHLLAQRAVIEDMHFMLQKEVVDRMVATPGSKTYGRLSVMLQAYCEVQHLFDIGPGAFTPPPKVHSSLVRLKPLREAKVNPDEEQRFAELVLAAFSQRRKTLRNNLKGLRNTAQIIQAGIDPGSRAETLSVDDLVRLSRVPDRT